MAQIQTRLQFNVRKKRLNYSELHTGKENKSSTVISVFDHQGKPYETKTCSNENENIETKTFSSNNDGDSDIHHVIKHQMKKLPSGKKRLQTAASGTEDVPLGIAISVSPPKRGKIVHEGNFGVKRGSYSPCTSPQLATEIQLNTSPSYTTSSKNESENYFSPRRLFARGSAYQQIRQAFQSSTSTNMPGREEHLKKLQTFLHNHLADGSSGTLYMSGPPGTGKTSCLSKITDVPEFKNGYKIISVNCTSMKSSGSIFARIAQELCLKTSKTSEKNYLTMIEKYLASNRKMILLILDEIDQLDSRKQSVLYTIFEWPSRSGYRIVLIGIANALDLTDRILPRLQARLDLKPLLLHFAPYTKMEIVDIITERLKECGVSTMFPPAALQLLAGKVASTCGDVRRALDIGRRVIELAETQMSSQTMPLQSNLDFGSTSPRKSPRKNSQLETIGLKEVMTVLGNVYGTSQSLVTDCDDSFPLQQKVLVSVLLLMLKKGRNKDITIGKLHEVYCRVCRKKNFLAIDQAEFVSLCQLVETKGILRIQRRKESRLSRVCLEWDEEEVCAVLKDKQLLASILNDTSCLS
ncbi:cell division control protein 6 homolog isoform X2 [Periplaneta americana]|uniref:cell division control protein 6 homolog isoform X2 n=1 Tax=Periplaneta americana TaxID=6978 RepID=UPI0037E7D9F7